MTDRTSLSAARLAAVQALYEMDLTGVAADSVLDEFLRNRWKPKDGDPEAEPGTEDLSTLAVPDGELLGELVRGVNARLDETDVDILRNGLQRRELLTRETSLVGVSIERPTWAREVTKLLFRAPPSERPDALLVADDNLLEPATRGLKEMGLRAPEDVLIIGHTNFPWPAPSHLPLLRLGYSATDMLNACIGNIDLTRQGRRPNQQTVLPPLFDESSAETTDPIPWPGNLAATER